MLTMNHIMSPGEQREELKQKLDQRDQEVREKTRYSLVQYQMSEQEAIEALKLKIQEEIKRREKIQAIQMSIGGPKAILLISLERQKISNIIEQKFGFDLEQLEKAVKELNLAEKDEIVTFMN